MKRKLCHKGITFYKFLAVFFIITFICTFMITSWHIYFLNQQEQQLKQIYRRTSDTVFENINVLSEKFSAYKNTFLDDNAMACYENIISANIFLADQKEAEDLWKRFFQIYNSTMSGAANTAYLHLKNSGYTYSIGQYDAERDIQNEIEHILGLTAEQWEQLLCADSNIYTAFVKTDAMNYGRLMISEEIYPGIVLIVGIAETNFLDSVNYSHLPADTQIFLATANNQLFSTYLNADGSCGQTTYTSCSFETFSPQISGSKKCYRFSDSLCGNTLKAWIFIPNHYYEDQQRSVLISILCGIFIWLVVGGLSSYFLTSKLYQPIEELLQNISEELPKKRGFHEFHLIRKTLNDMTDKNNAYEILLDKQNAYLAYNLWIKVLKGELAVNTEIKTLLENAGFPKNLSSYVLIQMSVISCENKKIPSDASEKTGKNYPVMLFLENCCKEWDVQFYGTEEDGQCTGIIENKNMNKDILFQRLTKARQEMQNLFDIQIIICGSDIHTVLSELPEAYQEITVLTEYSILLEDYDSLYLYGYNISAEDMSIPGNSNSIKTIHKISACLSCEQYNDALDLLHKFFSEITDLPPGNLRKSSQETQYLLDTIILSINTSESNPILAQFTADYPLLKQKPLTKIRDYLLKLTHELQKQSASDSSAYQKVLLIQEYIQKHYTDCNLSAQTVAETFHISIPWLSTVFKRETKQGFLEYIHRCRIKKAQQLMTSSDLSLKDIAQETGYANYMTMSRAFKRYVGVTPKLYRADLESK